MKLKIQYKGRSITPRDLERLSNCFGEKIDDMKLCQAVILRVMQSHNALARGAVVRALDTGRCAAGEGGRDVRKIIRRARRELGYTYTWHEHYDRIVAGLTSFELKVAIAGIFRSLLNALRFLFRMAD
ncbi:MAG TPA: hypothetical protein PLW48_00160 [Alphaproteobacteria bacterium]|nr:hypothetical protein [Rhodospirillaceae bacterium]HRJ65521.1 hypothetical protein [Alphaproteobacteria bacterium]